MNQPAGKPGTEAHGEWWAHDRSGAPLGEHLLRCYYCPALQHRIAAQGREDARRREILNGAGEQEFEAKHLEGNLDELAGAGEAACALLTRPQNLTLDALPQDQREALTQWHIVRADRIGSAQLAFLCRSAFSLCFF